MLSNKQVCSCHPHLLFFLFSIFFWPYFHLYSFAEDFIEKRGCCRENYKHNHHDSATVVLQPTSKACADMCNTDSKCTAFEARFKKEIGYKCELHTADINSASRKTKSCKKSTCYIKDGTPAPTPAPTLTISPTPTPTSAPTALPEGECPEVPQFEWEDLRGCCREDVKINHPPAKAYFLDDTSLAEASASCSNACAVEPGCTAYELSNKKKSTSNSDFKCELHDATINSARRNSKSCKRAECHYKVSAVPCNPPNVTELPTTKPV